MTFEEMQSEMKKRGARGQTTNSITARMCYDILSGAGTLFEDISEAEEELDKIKRSCENQRRLWSRDLEAIEERERKVRELSTALKEAQTEEARDRIRLAEYFKDNCEINTKYDNTAFINGLAAILAGKKPEAEE